MPFPAAAPRPPAPGLRAPALLPARPAAPCHPSAPPAAAIRYARARRPPPTRVRDDGRIELDNNTVERAIRPIALGRKNHLFAGSDGGAVRWATVCSLIATAKLNNVEPFAWLSDVLQRMTDGHPASRLDEFLPWNWQPSNAKV